MFFPLPSKMEKLETAVQRLDVVKIQHPPPFLEIGKKLRKIYETKNNNYEILSASEWRKMPYAFWVTNELDLDNIFPNLYEKYWTEILPGALQDSSRRAKRWLMPLFFIYCLQFDAINHSFQNFSSKFQHVLPLACGSFAEKLRGLNEQQKFLNPELAPETLARFLFLAKNIQMTDVMQNNLLWPGFEGSKLGQAIFAETLKLPPENLRELGTAQNVMGWMSNMPSPIVKTDLRVAFADGMLLPWHKGGEFSENLKKILLDFFLQNYGDPSFKRYLNYQWDGVNPEAIKVMHYLLTGDTLRGFMRILERTADDIWRYRQKFWMAYYEAGHIEEAWMILGNDARRIAKNDSKTAASGRYGRLEGGATQNQSVLLIRIGGLIFSEWSHSGSLRAYHEDDSNAPAFYQLGYQGQELRDPQSLDFHDGLNMRPELRHTHSNYGTWQRKARDMIRRHTGINLNDVDILL